MVGQSQVENIEFLRVFEYFLEETEDIKKAFMLYRSMKQMDEKLEEGEISLSQMQKDLLSGMGKAIYGISIRLGHSRLKQALEFSKQVVAGTLKFREGKNRKVEKAIVTFNRQVEELLSPLKRMGIDFDEMVENV